MIKQSLDRRLQTVIAAAFIILVFFLPLLVSTRSSEVFELPKMLFVYAMTAVIVGLWLGRMILRRQILILRTPLDIPILLFLISQMVSTIYSIDPHVSWWGWYGRFHGGLISTISYTLLYYAFVSNYFVDSNKESPWRTPRRLLNIIIVSAFLVSIYAILQHFGVDKNFWVQDVANRVFSTQGQPNWLAAYLVMTIPVVFAMIISSSLRGVKIATLPSVARNDGKISIVSYFLFLIYFLALFWTKSRSGLLGLAAADLVFWSLIFCRFYLMKNKSYIDQQRSFKQQPTFSGAKKLYRSTTIVHHLYNLSVSLAKSPLKPFILIHILMIGLVLATNNPAKEWIFGKLQATGDKRQAISVPAMETGITLRKSQHGGTESGDIRRIVWNGAIQLVKQRPAFGFGPETFGETYWRVRPKEHNLTSEWNFLYNKAHNEWLNLAANTGLFGLGSHILLLGWFSIWMLKGPTLPRQGRTLSDAILAAIVGVEAVNFFGFSTVTVGTYRYLFMAAAVVIAADDDNKLLKSPPDRQHSSVIKTVSGLLKSMSDRAGNSVIFDRDRDRNKNRDLRKNMDLWQKLMLAALTLITVYFISQVTIFFLADLSYNRGRAYRNGGYIQEAVEPLIRAVNLAPGEPVFRVELAEAEGAAAALLLRQKIDNSEQITENSKMILELKTDVIANFEIVTKQSHQNLGFVRTQAKTLFLLGEYDPALQLMKVAMEMAPTNPQLPYSLGIMLDRMGKTEEAALYYNKAVELKPDYPELR